MIAPRFGLSGARLARGRGLLGELLRDSGLTGAGILVSAAASFAFTFVAARALGPESYGWLGALLGIYGFATICSGALMPAITAVTARAASDRNLGPVSGVLRLSAVVFVGAAALIAATAALARSVFGGLTSEPAALVMLGGLIGLTFLVAIWTAALRGLQRFLPLAILLALDPITRFGFGIGLLTLLDNARITASVAAYVIGTLVFLTGGAIALRRELASPVASVPTDKLWLLSRQGLLLTLAQALYTAAPPILAYRLLGAEEAGYVAAALALSNVMIPFLDAISTSAYPRMVITVGEGRSARLHFTVVVLLILVAGGAAAGGLVLLGGPIVLFAYGPAFLAGVALLPGFAVSRLLLGLVTGFLALGFAEERFALTWAWLAAALGQVVLLFWLGSSGLAFAWIAAASAAIGTGILLADLALAPLRPARR